MHISSVLKKQSYEAIDIGIVYIHHGDHKICILKFPKVFIGERLLKESRVELACMCVFPILDFLTLYLLPPLLCRLANCPCVAMGTYMLQWFNINHV